MQSKWVSRGKCPCGESSNGYNIHADGHAFCFSCNKRFNNVGEAKLERKVVEITNKVSSTGDYGSITDRRISEDTARKYRTKIRRNGSIISHHYYEYFNAEGSHVATKVRQVEGKRIWSQGDIGDALLFGQNLFKSGGKYVTICEGELDALAAYEMLGSKWPVLSIKDGAASALRNCKANLEYLSQYENIVLCFDNDDSGRKAAKQVASLFEPNQCKIVHLDYKDACEYIQNGKREEFTRAWWNAKIYTPAGILNLADMGDALYEEGDYKTCLYPWQGINDKLYGIRTGELVTFTAGTGTGKSSVIRELMHHVLNNTEENIGVISLEENVRSTIFHLMSVEANARLYIREIREQFSREDLTTWQEATVGTRRFFAFDHFGSMKTDEILGRIRYMIKALDCKWIFLDHLSILVSGLEGDDERRNIDNLMTKLRSIVEETNVALLLVSHLRRGSGDKGHEDGKEVSLAHLRGSQSIAQLSDAVVAMERDQQSDDPNIANTTTIRVLKNRYAGDTGVACHLFFNGDTGRLTEVDNLGDNGEEDNLEEAL